MKTAKKKLKINGMDCAVCTVNIDLDLEELNGVKKAKTSYAKQICEIEFDSDKISEGDIKKQIKETGYNSDILD